MKLVSEDECDRCNQVSIPFEELEDPDDIIYDTDDMEVEELKVCKECHKAHKADLKVRRES